jgi:ribosomal protein L12E/L44/L45/RPP1/RPP2
MSMDRIVREEARLVVLKALADEPDRRLNSSLLQQVLQNFGITRGRDWVHNELRALADLGAVEVIEAGPVRIAVLRAAGLEHVERRRVLEGVKRPSPEF